MAESTVQNERTGTEIAVIGMAGRFPGAKNISAFWENLKNGVESISFINDEELKELKSTPGLLPEANYVKTKGGVIEDREFFDAAFFEYTPREAEVMNPQVRIFHETAWQALEDAGYVSRGYTGVIGLYAGATSSTHWEVLTLASGKTAELGYFSSGILNNRDFLSTQVAYRLNLKGPCFTVQTACSTSLVAVHLACQGILNGESDMALAGGITVLSREKTGYVYQNGMILSPDGHCRAFDAKAKGIAGGEGVGIVVLKSLEDALADRDYIYAVVKGTAVNNDGIRKVGYTAPSVEGQAEVIKIAQQVAEVEPETISYVEAHGTGTELGDIVEIEALKLAFPTGKKGFCGIGSVKTNIGHLDSAAGAAGFIKVVLAIKHRLIPPSLHFEHPNPRIDFKNSPFYVNTGLKEWKNEKFPLRAGISSFGIGGTNAHVILEEAPKITEQEVGKVPPTPLHRLILLSARTEAVLDQVTRELVNHLKQNPDLNFADTAYTLQVGRRAFPYRKMALCTDVADTIDVLSAVDSRKVHHFHSMEEKRPVVFMFPGLGSHYVNMGLELYRKEPVFREEMNRCFEILETLVDYDIKEILYPPAGSHRSNKSDKPYIPSIHQPAITQVLIFIVEYALARVLIHWGIQPHAMIGYSFGEYTAACISGVLSLEDMLKLVVIRGQLIQKLPPGSMLSVPLPVREVSPLLSNELSIAVDNGSSCIIAGPKEAVSAFEKQLQEKRYICMPLTSSYAVHSKMMDPILHEFEKKVSQLNLQKLQIPYISNVTGKWQTVKDTVNPAYWSGHLRGTVQFAAGIKELLKEQNAVFVEIGPGRDLSTMVRRYMENNPGQPVIDTIRHPGQEISDVSFLMNRIGYLWLWGVDIDWEKIYTNEKRYRIPLPAYPFEGDRYWIEADAVNTREKALKKSDRSNRTTASEDMADWFYLPSWKRSVLNPLKNRDNPGTIRWLIFASQVNLHKLLATRLKKEHRHVIIVKIGDEFKHLKDSDNGYTYTINPEKSRHYEILFKELQAADALPDKVIHCWQAAEESSGKKAPGRKSFDRDQYLGFFSILYMIKAMGKQKFSRDIHIFLLTNQVYEVIGGERLCPGKATALGLIKVIPQEYPYIRCSSIDIHPPGAGTPGEAELIESLLQEFTGDSFEPAAAYRNNRRWVPVYEPLHLQEPREGGLGYRKQGVYLVTGGLGKIGLIFSELLVKHTEARLILTGRSPFPPESEWNRWLDTHEDTEPVALKIKKLQRLQDMGGKVLYLQADAADPERMRQVVARAEETFGKINGVIHAAGIVESKSMKTIQELSENDCRLQFQAKVHGAMVLDELFAPREPDFCWMLSSVSCVLGGLGFGAYASANFFMDVLVKARNGLTGSRWMSLNWDGMDIQKSSAAFMRIFSLHKIDQVVVSRGGDLQARIRQWVKLETLKERKHTQTGPQPGIQPRPALSNEYIAARNTTEQTIAAVWQDLFGFDKIGIRDDFLELGGDSLKAITVISRIHKQLKVEIPITEIFNQLTIEKLAEFIESAEKRSYLRVTAAEQREYYVLSSAQKRLYILHQLEKNPLVYNETQVAALEGGIRRDKFERAFRELINRHEILRTSVEVIAGEPVQRIHPHHHIEDVVTYFDIKPGAGNSAPASDEEKIEKITRNFVKPFDLSKPCFLRAALIKIEEDSHVLVLDKHHMVTDGVSHDIFVKEFISLYRGEELPPLRIHYKDYSGWQQSEMVKEELRKQEEYWLKEFAGEIPILNLPTDYPRPAVQSFAGRTIGFGIGAEQSRILKKTALGEGTTTFMMILAIFSIFLAKISGQEDIIVGTDVVNRTHADLEQIIGMFANTLPLRNSPQGEKTFKDFLKDVSDRTLKAFENQDYQFENLVESVSVNREASRSPIFDVFFSSLEIVDPGRVDTAPQGSSDLEIKPYGYETRTAKFDLTLNGRETPENLFFSFEYCTKLFRKDTIERFIGYFKKIVSSVIDDINLKISRLEIISETEKNRLLFDFNNTKKSIVKEKNYVRLFEETVKGRPDKIAAIFSGQHITYHELSEDANRIANLLSKYEITAQTVVGIYIKRSINMLASIIGIFKAGAAYLPIEVDYPRNRVEYIIADSRVEIVIAGEENIENLHKIQASTSRSLKIICREAGQPPEDKIQNHPPGTRAVDIHPDNLAYLIYTSGTTGNPKGVMIHQLGMLNHLYAKINDLSVSPQDIMAQTASAGFDISVWQFLAASIVGGTVVIIDKAVVLDARRFLHVLQKERVTILELVPSLIKAFIQMLKNQENKNMQYLKWMIPTGEPLTPHLVKEWYHHYPGIMLVNAYGPTEASDDVTHHPVTPPPSGIQTTIPIGKPLQNLHIYIVDKYMSLCPIGVRGEICVAGIGVGKGYWRNPRETKRFFIPNPFCQEIGDEDYATLYKTGDIGYYREDGNIECLGRLDHQVKIRGNRIELGEIENQLVNHPGIREAVAICRDDDRGDKYICAYIVSAETKKARPTGPGLREYLSQSLPGYMIPTYIVELEKIPLTPNGKIDRKALPAPGLESGSVYAAPGNETEKKLAEIWAQVLFGGNGVSLPAPNQPLPGIDDNFFQAGGHSLTATLLANKIHQVFQVKLPLVEIFKTPTIRGIAAAISKSGITAFIDLEKVEKKEFYEPSYNQRRLWFIHQLDPRSSSYHLPSITILRHEVEEETVKRVFYEIARRHESFRTRLEMVDNEVVQVVEEQVDIPFKLKDISSLDNHEKEKKIARIYAEAAAMPFELSKAPLFRAVLVKMDPAEYRLIFNMHHIISDGWSIEILKKELFSLYEGLGKGEPITPRAMKFQYKDFSAWQNKQVRNIEIKEKSHRYWGKKLENGVPVLKLPVDYRGERENLSGRGYRCVLREDIKAALEKLAQNHNTTLFMVTFSAYIIMLSRISGQRDIACAIISAGRRHESLNNIVGYFTNSLPVISRVEREETYDEFLRRMKTDILEIFQYENYPIELVLDELKVRYPDIPVAFNMLNMQETTAGEGVGAYESSHIDHVQDVKFDVEVMLKEYKDGIEILCSYKKVLFEPAVIELLSQGYLKLLDYLARDTVLSTNGKKEKSSIRIKDLKLFDPQEIEIKGNRVKPANDFIEFKKEDIQQSIGHRFEQQVEKYPDKIAVKSGSKAVTYDFLNRLSNRLGHAILEKYNDTGSTAVLLFGHDVEMVVGIMGAVKSGKIYVPLDPGYPRERLKYIMADLSARLILTNNDYFKLALELASQLDNRIEVINIDEWEEGLREENPGIRVEPGSGAYILYTSGSTGKPKGVLQDHRNVLHFARVYANNLHINLEDRLSLFSNYGFDAAKMDIYGALLNGAALYPYDMKKENGFEYLPGWLKKERITIYHSVPSLYRYFTGRLTGEISFDALRFVVLGGEKVYREDVEKYKMYFPGECIFINGLGPTESTVTLQYFINKETELTREAVPVGYPVDETGVYLINSDNEEAQIYGLGEIIYKSDYLALGYMNDPEKTSKAFGIDPIKHKGRVYRTGDLGRLLPDGNIEVVGRKDFQVKVRGYRVEPAEIETVLLQHPEIYEAVVIAKAAGNGNTYGTSREDYRLWAYFKSGRNFLVEELREYLAVKLPDYMIPAYFVKLDTMPLTPNGKIDKKSLDAYGTRLDTAREYTAPETEVERILIAAWKEVLKLDRIGIHDNFFDLGGNSIAAINLYNKLKEIFKKDIPVAAIYRHLTIRSFARYLTRQESYISTFKDKTNRSDEIKRSKRRLREKVKRIGAVND